MVKIRQYANSIERFLHGEKGQRFFNFAYSVGAAIVIWGALFKILHLPGGNVLLCIGMGTEIAMFILTAFDRPPKEYNWEEVFPVLDTKNPEDRPGFGPGGAGGIQISGGDNIADGNFAGGNITINGGGNSGEMITQEDARIIHESVEKMATASEQLSALAELTETTRQFMTAIEGISHQMTRLHETIAKGSEGYAGKMEDLNRNLGGLNTIYEIQLKNISGQLETIDRVNRGLKDIRDMYEKSARESSRYCEETERMARYMRQINQVYEKMITAMTINMQNPVMGKMAAGTNPFQPLDQEK